MALAGSRHFIVACDRCGRAEFSLLPAWASGE